MTDSPDLESIVANFRDTNLRLQRLADAAQQLSDAEAAFETAKVHAGDLIRSSVAETQQQLTEMVAASDRALDSSQRALRDTTSGLTQLIDQVRDVCRELGDLADAFRKTDPERAIRETLRNRLEIRIAIAAGGVGAALSIVALTTA
jgi:uncharacterized phage infection (PIP) family protein YhgE